MPSETPTTGKTGEWVITLHLENLDKAMQRRQVTTYRQLARLAGIGERTLHRAMAERQVRDTAAGKIARVLHVYPHDICRWELR